MKKNGLLSRSFEVLVFLFLYAPIVVLIIFSFNSSTSRVNWTGFSLQWYQSLLHNTRILAALRNTLAVSTVAALSATVAGTAAAIGIYSLRRRSRKIVLAVNNIPLTNADIITGVSMMILFSLAIRAFNGSLGEMLGIKWRTGFVTLLLAHITFNIPYVILSVLPKLNQLDANIYEAAQDLGATGLYAFRRVVLPEIMPGVVNGLLIAFTMSIDDFVISYFTGGQTYTLATEIYSMVRKRVTPEINALSTLMFLAVLILLIIINTRQSRQDKATTRRVAVLTPQDVIPPFASSDVEE